MARILNALVILLLCCILLGGFAVQFFKGEQPCPLCMLQRLGMIGVAASLLLNLKFGIKPLHYGLALFSAVFGMLIALRHIALFACPGFGKSDSTPVFGLSLFTWSFLIFVCCILAIGVLLLLHKENSPKKPFGLLGYGSLFFLLLMTGANLVTTAMKCGLGPC